jgi:hypothetical protein
MWPHPDLDWPFWSPRVETIDAFIKAFRWLGYRVCDNSRSESWFEKVALYTQGDTPKHMARQLRDGTWTSKCGGLEDITHFTLDALESGPPPKGDYGGPALYMRRLLLIGRTVKVIQRLMCKLESAWPNVRFLIWRKL